MRIIFCSTLLCLCLAGSANAFMEIQANYWLMTPDGDVEIGSDGNEGTRIDLKDDLGYDQDEDIWGARAIGGGGHHQLGVDWFNLDISAENTIHRTVRFSDREFDVNEDVSSSFNVDLIRGFYRFIAGSDRIKGGFILGGIYVGMDAEASSESEGSASESVDTGAPVIGLHIQGEPAEWVRLQASIVGTDWEFENVEATFYDWEVTAQLQFAPFFLGGGYRAIHVDANDDDNQIDVNLDLTGPTAYAGFEW